MRLDAECVFAVREAMWGKPAGYRLAIAVVAPDRWAVFEPHAAPQGAAVFAVAEMDENLTDPERTVIFRPDDQWDQVRQASAEARTRQVNGDHTTAADVETMIKVGEHLDFFTRVRNPHADGPAR